MEEGLLVLDSRRVTVKLSLSGESKYYWVNNSSPHLPLLVLHFSLPSVIYRFCVV